MSQQEWDEIGAEIDRENHKLETDAITPLDLANAKKEFIAEMLDFIKLEMEFSLERFAEDYRPLTPAEARTLEFAIIKDTQRLDFAELLGQRRNCHESSDVDKRLRRKIDKELTGLSDEELDKEEAEGQAKFDAWAKTSPVFKQVKKAFEN
jgi:hypothetical protein